MRKQSKYKRKAVSINTIQSVIAGSLKLSHCDISARVDPLRSAVGLICIGQGCKSDWALVFDAINQVEQCSRYPKIMRDAKDYIFSMHSVITVILARQKLTKTKAIYQNERDELKGLVDLWAEALSTLTCSDLYKIETETHRRLTAIIQSKTPGVRVLECV